MLVKSDALLGIASVIAIAVLSAIIAYGLRDLAGTIHDLADFIQIVSKTLTRTLN